MKREARIIINGVALTEAQSCAVRVAINSFRSRLPGRNLGRIGPLYDARLSEVEDIIFGETS